MIIVPKITGPSSKSPGYKIPWSVSLWILKPYGVVMFSQTCKKKSVQRHCMAESLHKKPYKKI